MKIQKAFTLLGLICLDIALWILATTPTATGYEMTIYDAYPWYFWLLMWASIAFGISSLIQQAFSPAEKSRWWIASLLIVISANVVVGLLPVYRGYFISSSADEASYLGLIREIMNTGGFGRNVYPVSHIFAAELSYLTGINERLALHIAPSFFYLLYVMGLYLLARTVAVRPGQKILVITFGCILAFGHYHYMFMPTHLFLYLVPITLMLLSKKRTAKDRTAYTLALVIMLLVMPFTHPYGTLCVLGIMAVLAVAALMDRFRSRRSQETIEGGSFTAGSIALPASILFVAFSVWFYQSTIFHKTVRQAWDSMSGGGTSEAVQLAQKGQMGGITLVEFLKLLVNGYGSSLLIMGLSGLAVLFMLWEWRRSRSLPRIDHISFAVLFVGFALFYAATLVGTFADVGQARTMCWVILASILLNGIVLHEWGIRLSAVKERLCVSVLTVALVAAAALALLSVYPSPRTGLPNFQATEMEWDGMEWFLGRKGGEVTYYVANEFPGRSYEIIYAGDKATTMNVGLFQRIEPGFGYRNFDIAGDNYTAGSDPYIVITAFDRAYFVDLWTNVTDVATAADFNKLEADPSVNKVYSNGAIDIMRVDGRKEA